MKRRFSLSLFCALLAAAASPAAAQQVIEYQEAIAAGQRAVLNLRPADHIRVHAGPAGQLAFQATVSINQNQLNEDLLLDSSRSGAGLVLKTISGEVYTDSAVVFSNRRDHPVVGCEVRGTWQGGGSPAGKRESISGDVFFRSQPESGVVKTNQQA